ncbi:MAG: Cro/Cl family transcriptional regulator [Candidatus Symbiopectobacterium sp. Dall1.0]|nr:Cro/Cl family transcriptional regulator [Candidatus Symbiopectobacterium sp. Dall1.0]
MEELRIYLNSLSLEEQRSFAQSCGTSVGYLRKAISTEQKLGAELCVRIEIASNKAILRKQLHPYDWGKIWPELDAA